MPFSTQRLGGEKTRSSDPPLYCLRPGPAMVPQVELRESTPPSKWIRASSALSGDNTNVAVDALSHHPACCNDARLRLQSVLTTGAHGAAGGRGLPLQPPLTGDRVQPSCQNSFSLAGWDCW